jgi:hypothetical protein
MIKKYLLLALVFILGGMLGYFARSCYLPFGPLYAWDNAYESYPPEQFEPTLDDLRVVNKDLSEFVGGLREEHKNLVSPWAIVFPNQGSGYDVCIYVSPLSSTTPIDLKPIVSRFVRQRFHELNEQRGEQAVPPNGP